MMHSLAFHFYREKTSLLLMLFFIGVIAACHSTKPNSNVAYKTQKIFPEQVASSVTFNASIIASLLLDPSQDHPAVIVPVSNGEIAVVNGISGQLEWKLALPAPQNQEAYLVSTPLVLDNKLFVLYQCLEKGVRTSHRLVVIDLVSKQLDSNFPVLVLSAEKPSADGTATVKFNPPTAFSHSALKYAAKTGTHWGTLYAAFGNSGDAQPFHGWLFEIDIDAWLKQGANQAISHVLLTTPETECPVTLDYGTQEMICGGGIWTPEGPQLYPKGNSYEILAPIGNGQVDLARHDYANSIMRLSPGLAFDPECDQRLCKDFNPVNPSNACIASCKNLFIPRLSENDPPLRPANGECNDKSFWECLAWMDFDLGASSPVKAKLKNGEEVIVQPGKEGAVYLIDADHLGTQYDRLQIVDVCGTPTDMCKAHWMGMIVTHPVVSNVNNEPVVVIPTFVPDKSHPAGVVALKIVLENGKPKFQRFWQFPDPANSKAKQVFRSHPSLPIISIPKGSQDTIVWVVDIAEHGTLYGLRVNDGTVAVEQTLVGAGRQLSTPLIFNDIIYLASIIPSTGKTFVEAYKIQPEN